MRTLRTAVAAFALLLPAALASAADSKEEAPKTAHAKPTPAKKAAKTKAKGKEVTATPAPAPATPGQAK